MTDAGDRTSVAQTLYQCPRCTRQLAGPQTDELRLCECHRAVPLDDTEYRMKPVGTIETDEDGWSDLGPAAEPLQKGFGVLYENEKRLQLEDGGAFQDWDTKDEPVPGEIHGVEETRYGPRYEVCPDTDWWHPGREAGGAPADHVWHWEIVEVTERTRASVRLEELREQRREEA